MLAILILSLPFVGCGPRQGAVVEPHGLEVEVLAADPHGPSVDPFGDVRPGAWRYEINKTWTERRGGGDARPGRAHLELLIEVREAGAGMETHLELNVLEATGVAATYVREFDGLRVAFPHGPSGRPDPRRMRLEGQATLKARSFLRGLWLAGLAGATPWFPPGALQAGQTWPREALGELRHLAGLSTGGGVLPRLLGGGRLEAIDRVDGDDVLTVRFDGLLETQATRSREASSQGIRDVGTARFRARDGLPLDWRLRQEIRLHHTRRGVETTRHIVLEVEGKMSPKAGGHR